MGLNWMNCADPPHGFSNMATHVKPTWADCMSPIKDVSEAKWACVRTRQIVWVPYVKPM